MRVRNISEKRYSNAFDNASTEGSRSIQTDTEYIFGFLLCTQQFFIKVDKKNWSKLEDWEIQKQKPSSKFQIPNSNKKKRLHPYIPQFRM